MQHEQLQRLQQLLEEQDYIADRSIVMSVYLAMTLRKPLLIEGPAGVGKTEIAKVMARALDTDLIRLQCYEGWMQIWPSTSGTISVNCCT